MAGITLAGFLASAAAAVAQAEPLVPLLRFLGRGAEPVAVVAVTVVLTYLTLVIGELAPNGSPCTARTLRQTRRSPLTLVTGLTRPAAWLLSKSTDLLFRLAGDDPDRQRETVTEEEVRPGRHPAQLQPQHRRILVGPSTLPSDGSATCWSHAARW